MKNNVTLTVMFSTPFIDKKGTKKVLELLQLKHTENIFLNPTEQTIIKPFYVNHKDRKTF